MMQSFFLLEINNLTAAFVNLSSLSCLCDFRQNRVVAALCFGECFLLRPHTAESAFDDVNIMHLRNTAIFSFLV